MLQPPLLEEVADGDGGAEFVPRLAQDAGELIPRPARGAPEGKVATLTKTLSQAPMAVRLPSQVLPVLPFVAQAKGPLRPSSAWVGGVKHALPTALTMYALSTFPKASLTM